MNLWRSWIISAAAALGAVVLSAVLFGPLMFGFAGLGAIFLAAPLVLIVVATGFIYRGPRTNRAGGIAILITGWVAAVAIGAGVGATAVGIPFNAQSSLPPFLTWLTVMGPFAAVGVAVAIVTHTAPWNRATQAASR